MPTPPLFAQIVAGDSMKDKFKKVLKHAAYNVINYIASLFAGILLEVILIYPLEILFQPSVLAERIMRAILLVVGSASCLVFMSARDSYKSRKAELLYVLPTFGVVLSVQHIVCFLKEFYGPHYSSAAKDIARALYFGNAETLSVETPPVGLIHLCLLALQVIIFIPSVVSGRLIGANRYKRFMENDRKNKNG